MSERRHRENMSLGLMATLHDISPELLAEKLTRWGFRPGDITFHTSKSGRTWTTVHRWPWQVPTRFE